MNSINVLNKLPNLDEFYKVYWGKKPFIVRGAIDQEVFETLIDGDSLAGLSLDEDIKSRLVITEPENNKWICHHGPLEEDRFRTLGDANWSLLVNNVDQYHPDTAELLKSFNFSPRWLIDDIMVSYSAVGGSVGPHTDSYHVFLVQGKGKRKWKVSNAPIDKREYIDNADLLVLKDGFEGAEIEVSMGDVLYIPPLFGHQGVTTEEAMTFSVGFLGPKLSELFAEYSQYLEQYPEQDKRYTGSGLGVNSQAFSIESQVIDNIQNDLLEAINGEGFSAWVAEYFSISTHGEFQNLDDDGGPVSSEELLEELGGGKVLYRPEYIKIVLTTSADGSFNLACDGENIKISSKYYKLIDWLNCNHKISINDLHDQGLVTIVADLYGEGVLSLEDSKPSLT